MGLKASIFTLSILFVSPCWSDSTAVSYNPQPIRDKAEKVKALIANSKLESQKIASTGSILESKHVEKKEGYRIQNSNCHNDKLYKELTDTFETSCEYNIIQTNCIDYQKKARVDFESANDRLRLIYAQEDPKGMAQTLKTTEEQLTILFSNLVNFNTACSTLVEKKLFSNSCIATYDQVFDDKLSFLIANTCEETSVDKMTQDFIDYMNFNVIQVMNKLIDGHIESRRLEGEIAKSIASIRKSISKLNRSQASRDEGYPGL